MSNVNIFNSVTFIVEDTNESFHTYDDWELYVINTDCIGEPKQYTKYIEIPGRNGLLDLSEAISGRQIYTSRELKIALGGVRYKTSWDSVISTFRNHINGKMCRIIFDNDQAYYWRGRVEIKDFRSALNYGTFTINIPNADPYKYSVQSSGEPWLWDPFNFETGIITHTGAITVDGTETLVIPHGYMLTSPDFVVSNKVGTLTVTFKGVIYELSSGSNKIPSILIGGDSDATLIFNGKARIEVIYRSGSL